ncbi:MAG: hypothetical protein ACI88A_002983 [Paraglaciecola sp.]|jgi:hypothetical protein
MNKLAFLVPLFFLCSCASTTQIAPDAEREFERLYVALGMEDIIVSFDVIEVDHSEIVLRSFSHLPQAVQEAMLAAMGPKTVIDDPVDKNVAKNVFKAVLMGLLSAEQLAIAANFYSSEAGLKIHHSIIDAESAVSEYLDSE